MADSERQQILERYSDLNQLTDLSASITQSQRQQAADHWALYLFNLIYRQRIERDVYTLTNQSSASISDMKGIKIPKPLEFDQINTIHCRYVTIASRLVSRCFAIQSTCSISNSSKLHLNYEQITFDKDDADSLEFVCSASALYAQCYQLAAPEPWRICYVAGSMANAIVTASSVVACYMCLNLASVCLFI